MWVYLLPDSRRLDFPRSVSYLFDQLVFIGTIAYETSHFLPFFSDTFLLTLKYDRGTDDARNRGGIALAFSC